MEIPIDMEISMRQKVKTNLAFALICVSLNADLCLPLMNQNA